jgi:hypothetical protein
LHQHSTLPLSGRDLLSAKDNRILELSEQVAELGRKVFDLEENLREKDEVIAARSASTRPPVFFFGGGGDSVLIIFFVLY